MREKKGITRSIHFKLNRIQGNGARDVCNYQGTLHYRPRKGKISTLHVLQRGFPPALHTQNLILTTTFHFETSASATKYDEQRTAIRNRNAVRFGQSLQTTKVTRQCLYSSLMTHHTHAAWFYRTSLLSSRTAYSQNKDFVTLPRFNSSPTPEC